MIYHEGLADAFYKVLTTYIPPPAKILDPAAGYRKFYKRLPGGGFDGGYELTFGDIRDLPGLDYVGDCRKLNFADNSHDGIVFDPPYGNLSERETRGGNSKIEKEYTTISPLELELLFKCVNDEFARVLKPSGRLMVKIMDRHLNKKFYPFHIWCVDWLDKFELYDVVIYRYFVNRPLLKGLPFANKVHNYFMIFDKKPLEAFA